MGWAPLDLEFEMLGRFELSSRVMFGEPVGMIAGRIFDKQNGVSSSSQFWFSPTKLGDLDVLVTEYELESTEERMELSCDLIEIR